MTKTDERMLEALSRALRFEDDGVAYYNRAMKLTSNNLTLDVLRTLRDEEVKHKKAILGIYEKVKAGGGWVGGDAPGAPMPDFVSVFRRMGGEPPRSATDGELEALRHALDVEAEGRSMYEELAGQAPTDQERRFYELLGREEATHVRIIEDSIEYFTDPDAWFQKNERSVLDGA
jgi:rubrerythrin